MRRAHRRSTALAARLQVRGARRRARSTQPWRLGPAMATHDRHDDGTHRGPLPCRSAITLPGALPNAARGQRRVSAAPEGDNTHTHRRPTRIGAKVRSSPSRRDSAWHRGTYFARGGSRAGRSPPTPHASGAGEGAGDSPRTSPPAFSTHFALCELRSTRSRWISAQGLLSRTLTARPSTSCAAARELLVGIEDVASRLESSAPSPSQERERRPPPPRRAFSTESPERAGPWPASKEAPFTALPYSSPARAYSPLADPDERWGPSAADETPSFNQPITYTHRAVLVHVHEGFGRRCCGGSPPDRRRLWRGPRTPSRSSGFDRYFHPEGHVDHGDLS